MRWLLIVALSAWVWHLHSHDHDDHDEAITSLRLELIARNEASRAQFVKDMYDRGDADWAWELVRVSQDDR